MLRKQNKKGFTLAELLIVVAIIAVLVAIAVPLFVGSLNNAQKARDNANIRAVRGAAVVYLLEKGNDDDLWKDTSKGWDVEATINTSGEITNMTVTAGTDSSSDDAKCEADGENFKVTLHLKATEVSAIPTVPAAGAGAGAGAGA